MFIAHNDTLVEAQVWSSRDGCIGLSSFDCETTIIDEEDSSKVPDFIIGSAFNGQRVYFITRTELSHFFSAQKQTLYMANATFDLNVVAKSIGVNVFTFCTARRVVDIQIIERLLSIADLGRPPKECSLEALARIYLKRELPKDSTDRDGDVIRLSFRKFITDSGNIDYWKIYPEYLDYAAADAIATFEVARAQCQSVRLLCEARGVDHHQFLSHDLQLRASLALDQVGKNGLCIDTRIREHKVEFLESVLKETDEALARDHGWNEGEGSSKKMQAILGKLEAKNSVTLPRTKTGKISTACDDLAQVFIDDSGNGFVRQYIRRAEHKKLLEFLRSDQTVMHPKFVPLVSTGRTACRSPNVQNMPRKGGVREIFIPSPGHVFFMIDYSGIELCALAQVCLWKYGTSRLAELINEGVDLHRWFASRISGKPEQKISADERQKAKACNFGFPGGLGISTFREVAKQAYGIEFDETEALALKQNWLEEFPEAKLYLSDDGAMLEVLQSGVLSSFDAKLGQSSCNDGGFVFGFFTAIIGGRTAARATGKPYSAEIIGAAFDVLRRVDFRNKEKFENDIRRQKGSPDLRSCFIRNFCHVTHSSGRIRGYTSYTQSKNTPFQGLAADGAKEALWRLVANGFRVVNFIHDEFIIEVPVSIDRVRIKNEIEDNVIEGMRKFIPDVKISAEGDFFERWTK